MLLLPQKIFLGVLSVVSMTTACGKGSYSRWCDEEMNTNTPLPLLCFILFTAPVNNMRTLTFKAQPTNAFFATVNQMFAGSPQLLTAAERAVMKSLCRAQKNEQSSAAVVSWEDPPNTWLTAVKNAFVGWTFNFRVRVLLKSAVILDGNFYCLKIWHEIFWGLNFGLGILGVLIFAPIQSSLTL